MIKVKGRIAQYITLSLLILAAYLVLKSLQWKGSIAMHTLIESINTVLALTVGVMALIRHYSNTNRMLLVIGSGFLGVALLDGYHAVVITFSSYDYTPDMVGTMIASSWSSSRILLALVFLIGYLVMRGGYKKGLKEWPIYFMMAAMTFLLTVVIVNTPFGGVYYSRLFFHYPAELVPALLFLIALIGFFIEGGWKVEEFKHWLVAALIINLAAQLVLAVLPTQSFDLEFTLAHILKSFSYLSLMIGLYIKMFLDFKKIHEMIELGKETEWALRESQSALNRTVEELKVLLSSIPARVYSKKADLSYSACNDAFAIYHSITVEEVVGKSDYDLFSYEQAKSYRERDRECLMRGIPEYGIEQVEALDSDEARWELNTRVPYRDEKGRVAGLVVTSLDITTQKEAEQALKVAIKEAGEARKAAEDANRAKSEFLANMSHEIRTPMNGVIGTVDLALMSNPQGQQKEFLEQIRISAESLLDIINDILDFSKIEAGKLDLESIPFSLREIVESSVQVIAMKARRKGLEVLSYLTPAADRTFIGDPVRLRQIILNLLSNAVKFTDEGHIYLVARVKELKDGEVKVSVSVLDSGVGIDESQKKRLFKAFSQADSSTTRKYGGTGLGLVISGQLVEMMKGTIGFVSTRGKGTLFSFKVWLGKGKRRDLEEERVFEIDNAPLAVVLTRGKLLRKVVGEPLARWGVEVKEVVAPEEALALVQERGELLIIDEQVGDIDVPPGIPHLVLSSSCDSFEDGTNCLLKPFSESKFKRAVFKLLESGKVKPENSDQDKKEGVVKMEAKEYPEGTTVLLVEDNEINRKIAMKMLSNRGLTVLTAENGEEALTVFKTTLVQLVIMDIQMPVMDGFEAARELKQIMEERGSSVPIIALTAYAMKGDREKILQAGMNDYLTKPLTAAALYEIIDKYIFASPTGEDSLHSLRPAEITFDMEELVEALGGDREFAVMLLHDFDEIYRESLDRIDAAIAAGDRENLRVMAHTMKGQLLNLRLLSASPIMKKLDEASPESTLEHLKALSEEVRIETERVMDYVRANIF